LLDLNRTLFEGRPVKVQFAMQAVGERAGVAAWRAFAAAASEQSVQELLQSCSALEQANADFLQISATAFGAIGTRRHIRDKFAAALIGDYDK
jgi:hypothetical protein